MPQSSMCTYSAVQTAGGYNYEVVLSNTSSEPYDIYSFLLGAQYNVPAEEFALKDNVVISSPYGWNGSVSPIYGMIS